MAENLKADSPVSKDRFDYFVQRIKRDKADTDEARAKLGQTYSEVEDSGFNRPAMKMAIRLAEMEASKRSIFLEDLKTYCDWLGVYDQPPLPLTEESQRDQDDYNGGAVVDGTAHVDEQEREQIHADGKRAALDGRPASDNPFPVHSPSAPIWAKGWLEGEAENDVAAEAAVKRSKGRGKLKLFKDETAEATA